MEKHRTFRLNTEVSLDASRTWCPSAGCDTICHICAGTKSQVALDYDVILMDQIQRTKQFQWRLDAGRACVMPNLRQGVLQPLLGYLAPRTFLCRAWGGLGKIPRHHQHHHFDHQVKRGGEPVDPFFLPDNCNDNIKRCPMCSVPIERDAGCAQVIDWRERSTLIWWLFR